MLILGIDTSCDDTSAAVVRDGTEILSNIVSSQTDIHAKFGGIVPELASRRHIEMIVPIVNEALQQAAVSLSDLSAVAVCYGPGLIGSLLVGCSFAKAVCFSQELPLVGVNHLEGHILSLFLEENHPEYPFLSLIVSGGHTCLYIAEGYGTYAELGRTRDDAAGEAFDKVSKLLGLEYPGGPAIDRVAREGNQQAVRFPRAYLPKSFDFSFSGLKTAVVNHLMKHDINSAHIPDIAASFQAAVVDVLVRKSEWAIKKKKIKRLALSGGVSANSLLRMRMRDMGTDRGVEIYMPSKALCTDNAAMIAAAGYHHLARKDFARLDLNPKAYFPL